MINRVILVGRLTKDVEVRKTQSGLSVAQFTVACDRRFSRQDSNNNQQTADFINCVAWRQSADFLGSYARKGNLVGVEGRIQTRNYDDKDGKRVYVTEVVCDNVSLLESKRAREESQGSSYGNNNSYGGGYRGNSYGNNDSYGSGYNDRSTPSASSNENSFDKEFDTGDSLVISSDDLPF